MSTERPDEFSEPTNGRQTSAPRPGDSAQRGELRGEAPGSETTVLLHGETLRHPAPRSEPEPEGSPPQAEKATVVVRGETVRTQDSDSGDAKPAKESGPQDKGKEKSPPKELSEAKLQLQRRLPTLDDDADVGVEKDHLVTRDGKADLTFTGTLLASAAPSSAPQGNWREYRIYATNGGRHVFSKITRNVEALKQDTHEAEVFDPSPSSVPSKLLKSARELTHSRPLTWTDAAVAFFGYDPLAKALYRKFGGQFDERIG